MITNKMICYQDSTVIKHYTAKGNFTLVMRRKIIWLYFDIYTNLEAVPDPCPWSNLVALDLKVDFNMAEVVATGKCN